MTPRTASRTLQLPFPWFGGKRTIAPLVWSRFGDVTNYVEPFFGGGAVLLLRPEPGVLLPESTAARIETVNDKDGWLTNFWRALQADPDAVARYADWPVNEIDIVARREWLFNHAEHIARMEADPDYYDAKLAGIWVWGVCSTIGNAWRPRSTHLGHAGQGVHRAGVHLWHAGRGIHRARTHLGDAGQGIHRAGTYLRHAGQGIHRPGTHLGDAGRGEQLRDYFRILAARLERVRVMCGDWSRVTSPTVTTHNGLTGMFFDPPYSSRAGCQTDTYLHNGDVAHDVRAYCLEHGDDPKMRMALCGYEGEGHEELEAHGWTVVAWAAQGGYGNQSGNKNKLRERVWFSPHCLKPESLSIMGVEV